MAKNKLKKFSSSRKIEKKKNKSFKKAGKIKFWIRKNNSRRQLADDQQKPEVKSKKNKKYLPQILRGMKDFFGEEVRIYDYVVKKTSELAESYGFQKIISPILEEKTLFEKSTGLTSDIVEKQMYQFVDRGGNHVVMRPELTPSVARAYLENGMFNLSQPVRFFYFGPAFRYERPQTGRLRQFHQFGIEMIGSDKPVVDAQLVLFSQALFNELGLKVSLQINSLGCGSCRRSYRSKLINYFKSKRKLLCPDCQRRLNTNPLRILDCQKENCRELILKAPQIVDDLCSECQGHFVKVLEYLDEANLAYKLNPYLVRGLDYYTRTVLEIWPEREEGQNQVEEENKKVKQEQSIIEEKSLLAQSALGGGGRYDNLIQSLGGKPTPAVGVAYGVERIMEEIRIQKVKTPKSKMPQIFIAQIGEVACRRALKLFEDLRAEGFKVAENLTKDSLKAQMEMANKLGVKLTLIIGQQEMLDKTVIIRDMNTGNQEVIDQEKIIREMRKRIK